MRRRLVLVVLLFAPLAVRLPVYSSFAQTPENQTPSALTETLPPPSAPAQVPLQDEHLFPELSAHEREDAVMALGELRGTVRRFPQSADDRLKLAQGLYRIGDLDAAVDECRATLRLMPDYAKAHLQLGVVLMAKQEWRAALKELKEATRLDPELTQAHYSLGTVYYTTGNLKAAVQSYRQALELQPHFPDARYRLALVLKLTDRAQEAAHLMEKAAQGGIPQAQYFLGHAYRTGQGVEKNLALSIHWWAKAAEFGHQQAAESLSQLRRQTLSNDRSDRRRREAIEAFRQYRDGLWKGFPDITPNGDGETLGTALLRLDREDYALSVLLQEAYALSDVAHAELVRLYQDGWENHLAPFDKTILTFFEVTAGEGFIPSKKALASIYGQGLGVTPDLKKANALLKGLPKQEMKAVLDDVAGH